MQVNEYQKAAMAKVMEKRFANWQGQSFDEATLEPSDLAEAMMEYTDMMSRSHLITVVAAAITSRKAKNSLPTHIQTLNEFSRKMKK